MDWLLDKSVPVFFCPLFIRNSNLCYERQGDIYERHDVCYERDDVYYEIDDDTNVLPSG